MTTQRTYLIYGDQIVNATLAGEHAYDPPLDNVKDRRLQKIARCQSGATQVQVVWDEDVIIGGIAVINTSANSPVLNSWEAYSDDSFGAIVASGAFIRGRVPTANSPRNLYAICAAGRNITVRSMIIQLGGVGAVTELDIGRIFTGPVFWSENGGKFGSLQIGIIDQSAVTRAFDGTPYVIEKQRYREGALEFHAVTETEMYQPDDSDLYGRDSLYDIEQIVGSSQEVIVMPMYIGDSAGDAVIMDAQTIYGLPKWSRTDQYEKCAGTFVYRKTIDITESV